jgi:hypothetical protein
MVEGCSILSLRILIPFPMHNNYLAATISTIVSTAVFVGVTLYYEFPLEVESVVIFALIFWVISLFSHKYFSKIYRK